MKELMKAASIWECCEGFAEIRTWEGWLRLTFCLFLSPNCPYRWIRAVLWVKIMVKPVWDTQNNKVIDRALSEPRERKRLCTFLLRTTGRSEHLYNTYPTKNFEGSPSALSSLWPSTGPNTQKRAQPIRVNPLENQPLKLETGCLVNNVVLCFQMF